MWTSAMVCVPLQLLVELKTTDRCSIALRKKKFMTLWWGYGQFMLYYLQFLSCKRTLHIQTSSDVESRALTMQDGLFPFLLDHLESHFP